VTNQHPEDRPPNWALYVHDGEAMDTGKTLIAFRVPTPTSKRRLVEIGWHKTSPCTRSCASRPTSDDVPAPTVTQPGNGPDSASILAAYELLRRQDQASILPVMGYRLRCGMEGGMADPVPVRSPASG
jgi:hypothetical protein